MNQFDKSKTVGLVNKRSDFLGTLSPGYQFWPKPARRYPQVSTLILISLLVLVTVLIVLDVYLVAPPWCFPNFSIVLLS